MYAGSGGYTYDESECLGQVGERLYGGLREQVVRARSSSASFGVAERALGCAPPHFGSGANESRAPSRESSDLRGTGGRATVCGQGLGAMGSGVAPMRTKRRSLRRTIAPPRIVAVGGQVSHTDFGCPALVGSRFEVTVVTYLRSVRAGPGSFVCRRCSCRCRPVLPGVAHVLCRL